MHETIMPQLYQLKQFVSKKFALNFCTFCRPWECIHNEIFPNLQYKVHQCSCPVDVLSQNSDDYIKPAIPQCTDELALVLWIVLQGMQYWSQHCGRLFVRPRAISKFHSPRSSPGDESSVPQGICQWCNVVRRFSNIVTDSYILTLELLIERFPCKQSVGYALALQTNTVKEYYQF